VECSLALTQKEKQVTSDGEALFKAICEEPADDLARKAYADWLEENGEDERAELIRVQLDLAKLPPYDPGRVGLNTRERVLLHKHGKSWRPPLPRGMRENCQFHRGFLSEVSMRAERFLRGLGDLPRRTPLESVRLYCSAEEIEEAVTAWRQKLTRLDEGAEQARAVHQLVWQPLSKHLKGVKTVLVSPEGPLAQLPFAALPGSKPGTYLLEEVALALVPVPQLLPALLAPAGQRAVPLLLLVGDVDFDAKAPLLAKFSDPTRGAPRGALKGWRALPGTRAEVDAIAAAFQASHPGGKINKLRKVEPTRQVVRRTMSKSRYVHLATHGFFAPPELQSALAGRDRPGELFGQEGVTGWNPLLLSGIVLAGANKQAKAGEDDGILTALEVSEMDLPDCELVTLSACETGLGKEAGGEGLLGLQRAFQVAGAKSVVASLWKVDDKATSELMVSFYKGLWDNKKPLSKVEALRQAQLAMLSEGRKRGWVADGEEGRAPPYYWAGFVLSGDWR
jgi:uncharacterized protein (TIGR02996 family)